MVGKAIIRQLKQGFQNIVYVTKKELDLRNEIEVANWFKLINLI